MTALGALHLIFSLVAILTGAIVLLLRKGTRWHRSWGHGYLWSMVGVVVTSLSIYEMTGTVGPFHLAAIVAGVTVAWGMWSVLMRRPKGGWLEAHATIMAWSYIGLMAAFTAETLSRLVMPWAIRRFEGETPVAVFWVAVGVATLVTVAVGRWILTRRLDASIAATPRAMREEREELRAHGEKRENGEIRTHGEGHPND